MASGNNNNDQHPPPETEEVAELPPASTSRALIPFNPIPLPPLPPPTTTSTPAASGTAAATTSTLAASGTATITSTPAAASGTAATTSTPATTTVPVAVAPSSKTSPLDLEPEEEKKPPPDNQHKKRSKNWTKLETLTLIRLRTELAPRFAKSGRKSELWDEIADSLQRSSFSRDAQQCRDKWEKLMAGYKEVRDGLKHREDNPYFEELHPLLSNRPVKREREPPEVGVVVGGSGDHVVAAAADRKVEAPPIKSSAPGIYLQPQPIATMPAPDQFLKTHNPDVAFRIPDGILHPHITILDSRVVHDVDDDDEQDDHTNKPRKKPKLLSSTDLHALQVLVESIIARQQKFFKELLDAIDQKEQLREQIRLEREEKWRAEERAQRLSFTEAMHFLTQKLAGDGTGFAPPPHPPYRPATSASMPPAAVTPTTVAAGACAEAQPTGSSMMISPLTTASPVSGAIATPAIGGLTVTATDTPPASSPGMSQGPKRRSKNWKRMEVLQLIKLRGEMEEKFAKSTRRAALWGELAEILGTQGIRRDGKQCREKWDKLMSEYKEVLDGKKEKGDSPYFPELQAALAAGGRPGEAG